MTLGLCQLQVKHVCFFFFIVVPFLLPRPSNHSLQLSKLYSLPRNNRGGGGGVDCWLVGLWYRPFFSLKI